MHAVVMKKKYSRGELALLILKTIGTVGLVAAVVVLPGIAPILSFFMIKQPQDKYKLQRSYKFLKDKNYLEEQKKNGKVSIRLTRSGKEYLERLSFSNMSIPKPKHWDKLWRIVTFDIPENQRSARKAMGEKLNQLGFYPLQKSIFIYPYECGDQIQKLGRHFNVSSRIKYIVGCSMGKDEYELKKFFKL